MFLNTNDNLNYYIIVNRFEIIYLKVDIVNLIEAINIVSAV